jgi:uncharacterized protein YbjT (DUF2867 family)
MTVLVLGATGRLGKWILEEALQQGHRVHALVRNREKLSTKHERLSVFEGLPTDAVALWHAINGCEAVISALNISRVSDFPWANLRTPPYLLSETMRALIPLCENLSIHRVITCSAWGVAETKKDIPGWFRWFIDHSNIGPAYADHERQEKLLQASTLDWTSVRPTGLTNSKKEKPVVVSINNSPRPGLTISRKTLAYFMVTELSNSAHFQQSLTVSN